MKNKILTMMMMIAVSLISELAAQSNGFEASCATPAYAFYNGCFTNWISSHGSADVINTSIAITPYEGMKYAHMYSRYSGDCTSTSKYRGEGIVLNHSFTKNATYVIRFAIRTETSTGFMHSASWILTKGLINTTSSGAGPCVDIGDITPAIPTGSQILATYNDSYSTSGWTYTSVSFTANEDYQQLWFRPDVVPVFPNSNVVSTVGFYLDAFSLEECNLDGGFTVEKCQVGTNMEITVTPNIINAPHTWKIYPAISSSGGTGDGNMVNPSVPLDQSTSTTYTFSVPTSTSAYIIKHILDSENCPDVEVRQLVTTHSVTPIDGSFGIATSNTNQPTYTVTCTPTSTGTGLNHYYNYQGWSTVLGWLDVANNTQSLSPYIDVENGFAPNISYRVRHYAELASGSCARSLVQTTYFSYTPKGLKIFTKEEVDALFATVPKYEAEQLTGTENPAISSEAEATFTKQQDFKLYPNPAEEVINVVLPNMTESGGFVKIYNPGGQVIKEEKILGSELQINCKSWPSGIYIIELTVGDTKSIQRFIRL